MKGFGKLWLGERGMVGGGVMRWRLVGGGEEEEEGEGLLEEGFGVVEGFFFFLFLFGGREGGGGGVTETVESDGGERGEGVVNGRERWKRGGRVEDVRGRGFWRGILVW